MTYHNTREKWTERGQEMIREIDTPSPSCFKCSHFDVCKVVATLMPAIDSMFQGQDSPPLKGKDLEILANRCLKYEHNVE